MKLTSIAVLAAAAVMAGCKSQQGSEVQTPPMGFMGPRWSAALTAQPGSPSPQVSGSAIVMSNADSTQMRVEVSLASATPDARLPWHLHRGSCGNDQGVVGSHSDFTSLIVGSDGRASGIATIKIPMPRSGEYMINVHASTSDLGTIVACGNLTGPSGG